MYSLLSVFPMAQSIYTKIYNVYKDLWWTNGIFIFYHVKPFGPFFPRPIMKFKIIRNLTEPSFFHKFRLFFSIFNEFLMLFSIFLSILSTSVSFRQLPSASASPLVRVKKISHLQPRYVYSFLSVFPMAQGIHTKIYNVYKDLWWTNGIFFFYHVKSFSPFFPRANMKFQIIRNLTKPSFFHKFRLIF